MVLYDALQTSKNGFIYGSRLRFAHSIVISLLFGSKSQPFAKKLRTILTNTLKHGELLFLFAFIYKAVKLKLATVDKVAKMSGLKELIGGLVGGAVVYSGLIDRFDSGIAHQITLYCGSRVMLAMGKKFARDLAGAENASKVRRLENVSWAVYATTIWGAVMYLYETNPDLLQRSLFLSMHYIYDNDASSQFTNVFHRLVGALRP